MKERPILFSAPMVRAILDGSKTQTRRVIKTSGPEFWEHGAWEPFQKPTGEWSHRLKDGTAAWAPNFACHYGQAGDRLWVRETWQAWSKISYEYDEWEPIGVKNASASLRPGEEIGRAFDLIEYRATSKSTGPWTSSIHMPRWASRIDLEITGVRVERLNDISEADAVAEGAAGYLKAFKRWPGRAGHGSWTAIEEYWAIWEAINGTGSRAKNPWVWVVDFKRVEGGVK